jgi:hypothetical protein
VRHQPGGLVERIIRAVTEANARFTEAARAPADQVLNGCQCIGLGWHDRSLSGAAGGYRRNAVQAPQQRDGTINALRASCLGVPFASFARGRH